MPSLDRLRAVWQKVRPYLIEFAIIVLGILVAFQVEQWREQWLEEKDLRAAMERLREETAENLRVCESWSKRLRENALAVQHVSRSLAAGEILDGDVPAFERGLNRVGQMPDVRMRTSVASEMISTGLLKELDDPELRKLIPRLPALDEEDRERLRYWRVSINELNSELTGAIDYYREGAPVDPTSFAFLESEVRVAYDFEALASSRLIRNGFYDALHNHALLTASLFRRCDVVEGIQARLQAAIEQ